MRPIENNYPVCRKRTDVADQPLATDLSIKFSRPTAVLVPYWVVPSAGPVGAYAMGRWAVAIRRATRADRRETAKRSRRQVRSLRFLRQRMFIAHTVSQLADLPVWSRSWRVPLRCGVRVQHKPAQDPRDRFVANWSSLRLRSTPSSTPNTLWQAWATAFGRPDPDPLSGGP